ncbi:hypothetical protein [Pseudonocardia bannensis]|uniref:hypothetical protein n=1 Tax=Pseudonocardia bannensis TaxID=630973 RepID=UPI001B7D16B4|nr:hypothetical protein [Pseudonocardia bannensis]
MAGTYVYLVTLPFLAGLGRDRVLPVFRPNEALLLLCIAAAMTGGYLRYLNGKPLRLRFRPIDGPLAAFVLLSTLWPITSMMLRGQTPELSDMMAVLPICKLVGLLLLVRTTVLNEQQRLRCIRIIMWTAAVIAVLALLQTRGFGPVVSLLNTFWSPEDSPVTTDRGTTTLGHAIATGDFITIGLALVIASSVRGILGRRERIVLGSFLAAGVLASGQFSTWIAALLSVVVILCRYPGLRRRAVRLIPVTVPLLIVGAPVVSARLEGFGGERGLPISWLTRWDNIASVYWPHIADWGFLIGVSPNSVLPAPDVWRELLYLEAGYLQLLWVGGIPLFVGFAWFAIMLNRQIRSSADHPGATGACASALEVAWWMVLVLSLIDIHLLLRGSGDLIFTLIAITTGVIEGDRRVQQAPQRSCVV